MDDTIIIVCGCFRTWYAKRRFPKDGVRRLDILLRVVINHFFKTFEFKI